MNYSQALNYIEDISKEKGMVFGLDTCREMLERLGNPQKELEVIHVAGTNGKGSVGAYIASILDAAGYKTGRFNSPALFDFREMFSISNNGNVDNISEEKVAEYISKIADVRNSMINDGFFGATAFEIQTALACMYMAEEKCDICIVECGLGGSQDATNIFQKKFIDVITSIGMDHMNVLGDSIEEITQHKCGIIKKNDRVVTLNQSEIVISIINEYCNNNNAELTICNKDEYYIRENSIHGIIFDDKKHCIEGIRLAMLGTYQIDNAILAIETVYKCIESGLNVSVRNIKDGLSSAFLKGRFDIVLQNPMLIADGAHNVPAALRLKETIDYYLSEYKKIYIMGVFKDKQYNDILKIMSDKNNLLIACMSDNNRSLDSESLKKAAIDYFESVQACDSVQSAVIKAIKLSKEYVEKGRKTVIICFGSLSLMKEIYRYGEDISNDGVSRIDRVLTNELFNENLSIIEKYENKRVFCRHGLNHLLDVARISWIMCLENRLDIKKDIVYGASLLHDIGRARQYIDGSNHECCGVEIARKILLECGYSDKEIEIIVSSIKFHNNCDEDESNILGRIMCKADKLSRNCFVCNASDQCKWSTDMKNSTIVY